MNTFKKYMIIGCFLLVPFGFLSSGLVHTGQQFTFLIAGILVVASMTRNNALMMFAVYFAIWQVYLFIVSIGDPMALRTAGSGLGVMVFFSVAIIFYLSISENYVKIKEDFFYNVICLSAIIQAIISVVQLTGFDPVVSAMSMLTNASTLLPNGIPVGTLGNNNYLAAFLAISLPFFFRKGWIYFAPLISVMLFLCWTSTAVIAAIAGGIFYIFVFSSIERRWKDAFAMALILFCAFYVFIIHPSILRPSIDTTIPVDQLPADMPRQNMWWIAIASFIESPWSIFFGHGPGAAWGKQYPLHSEWVAALFHFGIVGVGLVLYYITETFRKAWQSAGESRAILLSSFVIIIVNMVGNSALHFAPSAFLIVIVCALLERSTSWQGKTSRP